MLTSTRSSVAAWIPLCRRTAQAAQRDTARDPARLPRWHASSLQCRSRPPRQTTAIAIHSRPMAPLGYMGAILDVDLTDGTHRVRELTRKWPTRWLGGTGLGAPPALGGTCLRRRPARARTTSWSGRHGPFAGTAVPLSNRFGVCARSPLTGVWGEAECGGHWANDLKKAGFDAPDRRGRADQPVYLWIHDGEVEIRDASHLWGKDTFETHDQAARGGRRDGSARPGDARRRASARPGSGWCASRRSWSTARMGGRRAGPGLGAVMGSKNLKAVAVRGTGTFPIADEPGPEGVPEGSAQRDRQRLPRASARWAPPAASRPTTRWATGRSRTGSRTTGPRRREDLRAPRCATAS